MCDTVDILGHCMVGAHLFVILPYQNVECSTDFQHGFKKRVHYYAFVKSILEKLSVLQL